MSELFGSALIAAMLAATIRIATPLLLSSIGELVVQRSGIWNLGIEGAMLMAAYAAYAVAIFTGSIWAGLLVAIFTGISMNMIVAVCAVSFKLNQFVVGLGVNLLAAGTSLFLYREAAIAAGGDTLPAVRTFNNLFIPGLSSIPFIGPILFSQQLLTYFAFLMVPVVWLFLFHTRY